MMTTRMTPVATSGDAALVSASLSGNREAFGEIVSRYQSLVCSLAYSATGSLSHSEDLAQETFLAAWKHLSELREPAKLRAWLCGIARNHINNSLRSQVREPSHCAAALDEITESRSPELSPVERAISQEEAEILWRSLERIPETYRVPLVLFYREHQSIEAVAQNLELEENAVRQRLSRGRKLLQEEVLSFVEVALAKTSPGKTFTLAVVATLPVAVTSATAASVGVAATKGVAVAKSTFTLGALGGLMAMLGANLFSWKTAVDDSKSPRERKFVVRMAWYQITLFVLSLVVGIYWISKLSTRPWVFGLALVLLIVVNVANGVLALPYMVRRRMEIGMEEGTLTDSLPCGAGEVDKSKTLRRAFKLTIPFLIMFVGMLVMLPWKRHWERCAVVTAAEALIIFWFFRRTLRQLRFQIQPCAPSRLPASMQHPFIKLSLVLFGTALVAGVGGFFLPFFLNPDAARPGFPYGVWFRSMGLCFLFAVLAYAGLAALLVGRHRILPQRLADKLNLPFLQQFQTVTQGPDAVIETTYAVLFKRLNLGQDRQKPMKELILKRTMVGVHAGMSLMNPILNDAKRTELTQKIKSETEDFNAQIKDLLGGENYAAFQQYEQTIPDRTMLHQFNSRFAKTNAALSADQTEQLLQALTEARRQYPWATELSRRNQNAGEYASLLTKENLNTFTREEEEFDLQFLAQARQFLNEEQLVEFDKAQERQRKSQISQFKMAAKLFGRKSQ